MASTPRKPRAAAPQSAGMASPLAMSARARLEGALTSPHFATTLPALNQSTAPSGSPRRPQPQSPPLLHRLRVAFPDVKDSNIVCRTIDTVLGELAQGRRLQEKDHDSVKTQVDRLRQLSSALEEQISLPSAVLKDATSLEVQVAQRESNRVAVEDALIRDMPPRFGLDGSVVGVTPAQDIVRDEPGEKKLRLLMEMLTHSTTEVARLREEQANADHKLALRDDKIIELEATVHTSNLSTTAMELAMTKLKRKAAVGGGGGGRAPMSNSAPLDGSTSGGPPLLASTTTAFSSSEGVTDRVSISRRSIAADRRRFLSENQSTLQVEAAGHDFGPRGRIGLAIVRIPHLPALARRYPDIAAQTLDTLRDAVRGMLEVCDGFEFRQRDDMFACAFDDCNSAVEFALSLTNHLHHNATWAKEVSLVDAFKTVLQDSGISLFHGLRASIGVHTGFWSGPVDLLCQRKLYEGELFDKAVIYCKSCPAGLAFISNEVLAATGMREFLTDKMAAVTPIPPWGVHVVLPHALKDRVAMASANHDAPLASRDMQTILSKSDVAQLPAVQKVMVCCQIEGFLNALIDAEIPAKDLYQATSTLHQHLDQQMFWSNRRGEGTPQVVRKEGEDKLLVLFDNVLDAFDFAVSVQEDAMHLCWPTTVLEAGLAIPETADVPQSQALFLSSQDACTIATFRGLRLQVGIHIGKCSDTKTSDLFNDVPRWEIPDVNVPVGLSCIARGGEIIASIAARDALVEEQRRCKQDVRLSDAMLHKVPKRISVPGQSDPVEAYYVATHVTAHRFRDAFSEATVKSTCRLAQHGMLRAPQGDACGIVALGIAHATLLHTTDPQGFKALWETLHRLVRVCIRRFQGVDCVAIEEHATMPHHQVPVIVLVFPDLRGAAMATLFLHEEALHIPMGDALMSTPFSQSKLDTNNQPLYHGPRLKMGLHVGRAVVVHSPPHVPRTVVNGNDVTTAVQLCLHVQGGLTLLSPSTVTLLTDGGLLQTLTKPQVLLHELIDSAIVAIHQKGNVQVLIPKRLKERVTSDPPEGVDSGNAQILQTLAAMEKALPDHNPDGTTSALASSRHLGVLPLYNANACVVTAAAQMFVVCRLPGLATFVERAPQFAKDMVKTYLHCARELLGPLHGKELEVDGEAMLIRFESAVHAVQWAQQLQVSLTCAKWPVEILSTDFCREVRSTTKSGGAGRVGALFRGPRALIVMEWGTPRRKFDAEKQQWHFFGDVVQFAVEMSHWGHGGMIVLSKRAKAVVVQELTQESTRQMLESPNIGALGSRQIRLPQQPSTDALERSNTASVFESTIAPAEPEALFSLIPLVFFERTYPPFPESASTERRFVQFVESMLALDRPPGGCDVHCMLLFGPALCPQRVPPISVAPPVGAPPGVSATSAGSDASPVVPPSVGTGAISPVSPPLSTPNSIGLPDQEGDHPPPSVAPVPLQLFTEEHLLAVQPFLFYFHGKVVRSNKSGALFQFPKVIDAVCFCLSVTSSGAAPLWTRQCAFAVDDDTSLETLATLVAPYASCGEVVVTEEALMSVSEMQCKKILRGTTLGRHAVLDAVSPDELLSPPLRIVAIAAVSSSAFLRQVTYDPLEIPTDLWRKPIVIRRISRAATSKSQHPSEDNAGGDIGTDFLAEAGGGGGGSIALGGHCEEGDEGGQVDVFAPFELEPRDEEFAAAIAVLDPTGETESKSVIKDLWHQIRQESTEDARRVKVLEATVQELKSKLEKHESNQKLSSEVIVRAHKAMRLYRARLDGFFKKAMVEEVVYGNDADLFVADWLSSMKTVIAGGSGQSMGNPVPSGGERRSKGALVLSPREEFGAMMRQSIDDDGGESRANPIRLYASMVGHLGRVFSGIERLLKQRDRIARLGAGMHRKASTRFPSASDRHTSLHQSGTEQGGRRVSLSQSEHAGGSLSPEDERRKSLRNRVRSVALLSSNREQRIVSLSRPSGSS